VLALPLIRLLAMVSGYVWILLAPQSSGGWNAVDTAMLGFTLYSVAVIGALWLHPAAMLRVNFVVLLADLTFALALIALTGGARSTLFLALLLIAGLQSYYYGIRRGVLVAVASAAAYVAVVWSSIVADEWADMAIRLAVLVGTAVGVGILADVEESDRGQIVALSQEARERERFIRSVVESLGEGLIALDRDGRVIAWNQAMEDRYGVAASEVLGRRLFDVNPAFEQGALAAPLRRLLTGEVAHIGIDAMEHQSLRRGRVTLNVKGSLLRRGSEPAGGVLLIEDITDRVALERAALQSEKLAAVGTLAAGVAHELNNPIGIMSSRIELMMLEAESQTLPEGVREDLQVLHRHAQRVARIVQGLLSFARQPGGTRSPVDLNRLVEETLLLMEKQIAKEGIALTRRLSPAMPPISGDANALQQVLINVLLNAREALKGAGEISIETHASPDPGGPVRVVVRDTGPGIPSDVLPKIFDPFFTTKPTGTGLGLSISYGIVRDHQGSLDVWSEPGVGTAFTLTLPAATQAVPA
jgi:PAS domain S-box-containing protein